MRETEVLVVGAGPSGAVAALLLARHGIDTLMISHSRWVADSPRAHITNQRTMEVMRAVGLEETCKAVATPGELMANHVMMNAVNGLEFGRMWSWGQDPARFGEYHLASPCGGCDLPQHRWEPVLVNEAVRVGATALWRTRFISLTEDEEGVTSVLEDLSTGETFSVRSKYVIGADGGQSRVAEALELPMHGDHGLGPALNVLFDADLTRYFECRPGSIFWIMQPDSEGGMTNAMLRMVTPWTQWVVGFVHLGEAVADLNEDEIRSEVQNLIRDDSVEIKIRGVYPWRINHVIADRYQSARVFCAGDAVHRHPPMNGLGGNTCVQDSFNLVWKIAAVLRWDAGSELLETYTVERQPVGKTVVDRAIASWRQNPEVVKSLGINPKASAEERTAQFNVLFEDSDEGEARRAAFQAAKRSKDFSYHAHGVELNQVYTSSAIIDDGSGEIEYVRDRELHYQPSSRPGSRVPHAWLAHNGRTISTLDLTGPERFTLLTRTRGSRWLEAIEALNQDGLRVPIEGFRVGHGGDVADLYGAFGERMEIGEAGCLLIRPDQHVAWRSAGMPDDPAAALRSAMMHCLSLETVS
jgi:2,4-dichlorophenol 6-monooxygenase